MTMAAAVTTDRSVESTTYHNQLVHTLNARLQPLQQERKKMEDHKLTTTTTWVHSHRDISLSMRGPINSNHRAERSNLDSRNSVVTKPSIRQRTVQSARMDPAVTKGTIHVAGMTKENRSLHKPLKNKG